MIKRTYTCSIVRQICQLRSSKQPTQLASPQPPQQSNPSSSNTNNNNSLISNGNPYMQKLQWFKNHSKQAFATKCKVKKQKSYRKQSTQSAIIEGSNQRNGNQFGEGYNDADKDIYQGDNGDKFDSELKVMQNGKLGKVSDVKIASLFNKNKTVKPIQKSELTKSLTISTNPQAKTSPQSQHTPSITSSQSSSFPLDSPLPHHNHHHKIDNETMKKMQNNLMQFYNFYINQKTKIQQMKQMFLRSIDHQLLKQLQDKIQQSQKIRASHQQSLNQIKILKNKIDTDLIISQSQIQKQIINTNMQLLKLITDHAEYKNMRKTTNNLQEKVQQVKINQVLKFQKQEQEIIGKIGNVKEENKRMEAEICGILRNIEEIKNLRNSLRDLRESLECNQNMKNSYENIYSKAIQQHSSKNIKQELQNSIKWHQSGQSNAQILHTFHTNLQKKIIHIETALNTYSEKHKMTACLELKQQQNPSLFLTRQTNKFTIQQQNFYDQNKSQFKIYEGYLQNNQKTRKLLSKFDDIEKSYIKSKNDRKKQIDNLKKSMQDYDLKIKDLDGMEKIRDAQIKQLYQIWQQKMKQLNLLKVQRDSFDIFRSSFTGFSQLKKSSIKNQMNQSNSSFYWNQ